MAIDGVKIGFSFRFGGDKGLQLADFNGGPTVDKTLPDHMVPGSQLHPGAIIGATAVGAVGLGMLIRGLEGKKAITLKDFLLDAGAGAVLGCGLVGDPIAEKLFIGGFYALPMAAINAVNDPKSDFRLSLLAGALLEHPFSELERLVPLRGWENDADGVFRFKGDELFVNGLTNTAVNTARHTLSNVTTALIEGADVGERAKVGAIYGLSVGLAKNLFLGPPIQPDDARLEQGIASYGEWGGPDLNDVSKHTLWRAGLVGGGAFTFMNEIRGSESMLDDPDVWGHELVHRDQIAGTRHQDGPGVVREGVGNLGFYTQYILWAMEFPATIESGGEEMHAHPYEIEPYRQMRSRPDDLSQPGAPVIGQYVGAGLGLGGYALFSYLLQPDAKHE